jgi:hypothetical protein
MPWIGRIRLGKQLVQVFCPIVVAAVCGGCTGFLPGFLAS